MGTKLNETSETAISATVNHGLSDSYKLAANSSTAITLLSVDLGSLIGINNSTSITVGASAKIGLSSKAIEKTLFNNLEYNYQKKNCYGTFASVSFSSINLSIKRNLEFIGGCKPFSLTGEKAKLAAFTAISVGTTAAPAVMSSLDESNKKLLPYGISSSATVLLSQIIAAVCLKSKSAPPANANNVNFDSSVAVHANSYLKSVAQNIDLLMGSTPLKNNANGLKITDKKIVCYNNKKNGSVNFMNDSSKINITDKSVAFKVGNTELCFTKNKMTINGTGMDVLSFSKDSFKIGNNVAVSPSEVKFLTQYKVASDGKITIG